MIHWIKLNFSVIFLTNICDQQKLYFERFSLILISNLMTFLHDICLYQISNDKKSNWSTYSSLFFFMSYHEYDLTLLLPHHMPKVIDRVWQRSLRCQISFAKLFFWQYSIGIYIIRVAVFPVIDKLYSVLID